MTTHIATVHQTDDRPTKQNQCFAFESWQANDFFIRDEIKLVKDGIVLCEILVLVQLLLATEP